MQLLNLVTLLAWGAQAAYLPSRSIVHEKRTVDVARDSLSRVHKDAVIPIRIALKQENLHKADEILHSIADPYSPHYGKHWSKQQVHDFFSPSDKTAEVVREWLIYSNVKPDTIDRTVNKGWLAVDLPASEAERLFDATYYEYVDARDGSVRISCDSYSLPRKIAEHIDYVVPGVTPSPPLQRRGSTVTKRDTVLVRDVLEAVRSEATKRSISPEASLESRQFQDFSTCSLSVTPDCIRALYSIPQGQYSYENALGVFAAQDYFSQADLNDFFASQASNIPQDTGPDVVNIDDNAVEPPVSQNTTLDLSESTIDLDMTISLVYPQTVTYYQVAPTYGGQAPSDGIEGFFIATLNFLDALDGSYCTEADQDAGSDCGTVSPPDVISMSYGGPEVLLTAEFQQRQCNEFMKLALQGHTSVVSSGDYGVGAVPIFDNSNGCISAENGSLAGSIGTVFSPSYPQNCPYVLSVGATQIDDGNTVYDPESAMDVPGLAENEGYAYSTFSSSGGFSNLFPRPSYQDDAVSSYLSNYDPGYPSYSSNWDSGLSNTSNIGENGGLYNNAGRAFPDVSANGVNFTIFVKGRPGGYDGTSLAAPLWASVLTLINEERIAANKGPVGFVNPVLYQYADLLNDITDGQNPGCGTSGFSAVPGWDPITGLGTPDFPKLLELFLSLP